MKIFVCQGCNAKYDLSRFKSGQKLRCKICNNLIVVPEDPLEGSDTVKLNKMDFLGIKEIDNPEIPTKVELPQSMPPTPTPVTPAQTTTTQPSSKQIKKPKFKSKKIKKVKKPAVGSSKIARKSSALRERKSSSRISSTRKSKYASKQESEQKKGILQNKLVLIGGGVGLVVIIIVIFALFGGKEPGSNNSKVNGKSSSGENSIESVYKEKLDEIGYKTVIKSKLVDFIQNNKSDKYKTVPKLSTKVFEVAKWCKENNKDKYEKHLIEAHRLDRDNTEISIEMSKILSAKASKIDKNNAKELAELGIWAMKSEMFNEGIKLLTDAFKIASDKQRKKITEIFEKFGYVNIGKENKPEWITKTLAEEFGSTANTSPRQREIDSYSKRFKSMFGSDFQVFDFKPFVIYMQNDPKVSAELTAENYKGKLFIVYNLIKEEFSGLMDTDKIDNAVLPVWIFANSEGYYEYGKDQGITRNVKGHFSPSEGWLMFPADSDILYNVLFHEGTHQIIACATRLNNAKDSSMFWFSEGMATFFECFKRESSGKIRIGREIYNEMRGDRMKAYLLKQKTFIPFNEFLSKTYIQFSVDMREQGDVRAQGIYASVFYAEAWSLVYFLNNYENGKYRKKFEEYIKIELQGKGSMESFAKVFGFNTESTFKLMEDLNKFQKEWISFVKTF